MLPVGSEQRTPFTTWVVTLPYPRAHHFEAVALKLVMLSALVIPASSSATSRDSSPLRSASFTAVASARILSSSSLVLLASAYHYVVS